MDDQDLLTKFSCMGTQDRDVLVSDLHEILGAQLSREGCVFFLEMTNWNLQAAVGAYYDFYGQSNLQPPQVCVVKDYPIAEGAPLLPMTPFTKTWRLKNPGSEMWPPGSYICQWSGHTLGATSSVTSLPLLKPGEEADVSVFLTSPLTSGVFHSQWKMFTSSGSMCGGTLFITVMVEDSTVMGVTQQLSAISTNEGDMDTGGGGTEGGASLLGGGRTMEQRNPFGGSPYSSRLNQSSPVLPNLIPNSNCSVPMGTTSSDSSSRQLLGNGPSELNALVTTLNDRVHQRLPEVTSLEISDSNSTQQQQNGNETGTDRQDYGNLENTMSPDVIDHGAGNVYPS